jgi:hypothetical protein
MLTKTNSLMLGEMETNNFLVDSIVSLMLGEETPKFSNTDTLAGKFQSRRFKISASYCDLQMSLRGCLGLVVYRGSGRAAKATGGGRKWIPATRL